MIISSGCPVGVCHMTLCCVCVADMVGIWNSNQNCTFSLEKRSKEWKFFKLKPNSKEFLHCLSRFLLECGSLSVINHTHRSVMRLIAEKPSVFGYFYIPFVYSITHTHTDKNQEKYSSIDNSLTVLFCNYFLCLSKKLSVYCNALSLSHSARVLQMSPTTKSHLIFVDFYP